VKAGALREAVHAVVLGRPLVGRSARRRARHFAELAARHQPWWMQDNVVGLCVARKQRRGRLGALCLQVLVEKKYAESKVKAAHRIPRAVESPAFEEALETDVRAVGAGRLHALVSNDKPARPGYDIGNELGGSGTLACVVVDNDTGARLGLSCAHVIAPDGAADVDHTPGQVVYYPSLDNAELLDAVADAPIGKLVRVRAPGLAPDDAATNVDAAVFQPDDPAWLDARIAALGRVPRGIRSQLAIGLAVQKVGAVTERTHGVVQTTTLAAKIPDAQGEAVTFVDHIGISTFAEPGDSGALVLDGAGRAIGLHIGGFDGMSVCTPIGRVLSALGCTLVTPKKAPSRG
jgi:hypothetical protein